MHNKFINRLFPVNRPVTATSYRQRMCCAGNGSFERAGRKSLKPLRNREFCNMNSVWMGHRKTWALIGIVASVAVAVASPADAARRKAKPVGGGYSPLSASIVVDAKTGKILQG